MTNQTDLRWMAAALAVGRRGMGQSADNPSVGCVIVKGDRIVGQGWTQASGRPHAEVMAIGMAQQNAVGATAYVTLEPCSHHGQSAPCADALVSAGVERVVVALRDPDPRVDGRGVDALAAAGLKVEVGVGAQEAAWDLGGFLRVRTQAMPFVTLKLATTLDGKIALSHGESKWITGPLARRWGHLLRSQHDAILTGARTVRADNPALTARVPGLRGYDPKPFILSSAEGLSGDYQILTRGEVLAAQGDGRLPDPHQVLATLARAGHHRVMIEAGSGVAALFLNAGLVDQIALFQAPAFIGRDGLNAVGSLHLQAIADLERWDRIADVGLGQERYITLRHPSWHKEVLRYV